MANRENYFILLGLSFDPIEGNESNINAAITAKQQQWSKDQTNPLKKVKAAENLKMLDDIKQVMLNAETRKNEAAEAKKVRDTQFAKLDEKISINSAKKYIKPSEIVSWVKTFGVYGITEAFIKQRIKVPISDKPPVGNQEEAFEIIDKSIASNIQNNFKQLGYKDYDLYKFLGLPQSSTIDRLVEEAEKKKKMLLSKGEKTGKDNAELALCGICVVIFKDRESKKKYDNYVSATKYEDLNDAITEQALSNNKEILPETLEALIDLGVKKYSISVSDAGLYIRRFCKIKDFIVSGGVKIKCGLCDTDNPANATTCSKCGKALFIICPKCNTQNGNTTKNCANCQFDLSKMNDAIPFIEKSKKELSDNNIENAIKFLEEAKKLWPNHPDVITLETTITTKKKQFDDLLSAITSDINEKKYYAAELKINQAKNNGFVVESSIESRVLAIIKNVEEKLQKLHSSSGEEAFLLVSELANTISDSAEVNKLVKNYPPEPVSNLKAEIKNNEAVFSWDASKSVGGKHYVLVRKKNTAPNSETDGEVVYDGNDTSYSDSKLEVGQEYYYAVFTIRIGVASQGIKTEKPLALINNVTNIKAIGGDGIVTLSWQGSKTLSEVKMWKKEGEQRPSSIDECEPLICNRPDGINIADLNNGTKYWFWIQAVHTINGNLYAAPPTVISAVPQKPAKPLENFEIRKSGNVYQATWKQSEWDVILLLSRTKPDYAVGVIYDLSELLNKYEKIDINIKNITEAEFTMNFIGESYIIPCVVNASNVILNVPSYVSNVSCVENITYDINASNTELYINFKWPKGIEKVMMVSRMDEYPTGLDDPLANKIECSKRNYDNNAALLVANPSTGKYYAVIYSVFESEGNKVYSEGVRTIINNEPQRDVVYDFKYKKQMFSSKRTLTINLKSSGTFMFPQFIMVAKSRSVPLNKADGEVVCSVLEESEINDVKTFVFDVKDLPNETFIKMFFVNEKQYKRYKLLNNASSKI